MPWRSGIGVMGNVSLADYVRECLPPEANVKGLFCNSTGTATKPPILRHGVPNTIIVFPGRFNPPTVNHAQLLHHVVRNAGQDLNIIAAVVCLIDQEEANESVRLTFGCTWDMLRSADERRDVWVGPGIPVDWVWVQSPGQCDWNLLNGLLKMKALQDDFDLRFLMLCGPDHFPAKTAGRRSGTEDPAKWGCTGWITSDVGQPGDWVSPSFSEPITNPRNCKRWERIVTKVKDVHAIAVAKFIVDGPDDLDGLTQEAVREEMRRIIATAARDWTCTRTAYPWGHVRFVPSPLNHHRTEANTDEIRCDIIDSGVMFLAHIEPGLAPLALNVRRVLTYAVERTDDIFERQVGWDEWDDRVEDILDDMPSMSDKLKREAAGFGVPDEDALYRVDMNPWRPSIRIQNISRETPSSALRSTILTHAPGAADTERSAPTARDIWGPNTYLNEDEPEKDGAEVAHWNPTYPFTLPEL